MEILTRLSMKSAQLIRTGGLAQLSVSDIAAACAGANRTGLGILLAKVVGDRSAQAPLFYEIYQQVIAHAVKKNWQSEKGKERFRSLVNLAIFEHVGEPRCPACKGTRYTEHSKCHTCDGSGYLRFNDKQRAAAIGVHPSVWLRRWKERYAYVCQTLNYHESDAIYSIYKRLHGGN